MLFGGEKLGCSLAKGFIHFFYLVVNLDQHVVKEKLVLGEDKLG